MFKALYFICTLGAITLLQTVECYSPYDYSDKYGPTQQLQGLYNSHQFDQSNDLSDPRYPPPEPQDSMYTDEKDQWDPSMKSDSPYDYSDKYGPTQQLQGLYNSHQFDQSNDLSDPRYPPPEPQDSMYTDEKDQWDPSMKSEHSAVPPEMHQTEPQTQISENSNSQQNSNEECKELGSFLPDPKDCHKYYVCVGGSAKQSMNCGPGTAWDQSNTVCDHEHRVMSCKNK
ncbi:uncharacterized protein LOC106638900 [Copidosoma floridanum]|uniref:uncharacterized protein LOC106638900 n=1 Tax=Copidosoma floridanum TaxID=29053 RepID=UPI000C6F4E21|nr:uncharacterized protein LOC106638900 [Copidosoma floridanum]